MIAPCPCSPSASGASRSAQRTIGKEIPDGVLVLGSPGKVVRDLEQEEKDFLLKVAQGYIERSRYYRDNLKEITSAPSGSRRPA
jgi:carbonic anhydrase/acetyltransferase-like protein (isoleucine patch superfamily)